MDVRRSVLDAALAIIGADGPDAVSMREVARRAGVSHQAPYHHFGDRAGIFAAIGAEGFRTLGDEFRAVLRRDSDAHPSRRCFEAYVRVARQYPGHFRVMFRQDLCGTSTHPDTLAAADAAYFELLNMVERTIGRPDDTRRSFTWASLLWSAAHGLSTLILDGPLVMKLPEGLTLDQHIEDVISLMGDMVEAQADAMGLTPAS